MASVGGAVNDITVLKVGRRAGKSAAAHAALLAWANKEIERALIGLPIRETLLAVDLTDLTPDELSPPPATLPARPRTALGWGLLGALVALSLVACTPNVQPPQVPPGYKESPYETSPHR